MITTLSHTCKPTLKQRSRTRAGKRARTQTRVHNQQANFLCFERDCLGETQNKFELGPHQASLPSAKSWTPIKCISKTNLLFRTILLSKTSYMHAKHFQTRLPAWREFCSISSCLHVLLFPVDILVADSRELFHLATSSTLTHSRVGHSGLDLFKLCNCGARSLD